MIKLIGILSIPTLAFTLISASPAAADDESPSDQADTSAIVEAPDTLTSTAGDTLTVTATVDIASETTVQLERVEGGESTTVFEKTLNEPGERTVTLRFPKSWWQEGTRSRWRLSLVQADEAGEPLVVDTSKIIVTATRKYQNPSKYVQLTDRKIDYTDDTVRKLGSGSGQSRWGVRVMKLMKRLKLGPYRAGYYKYSYRVKQKVKAFQKSYNTKHSRKKRLRTDGITDYKTWRALGFSKSSWKLDNRTSNNRTTLASTKQDHIEVMIARARKYLGNPYLNGASSTTTYGLDCSGLVMQALYAAGVTGLKNTPMWHTRDDWGSRYLWKTGKLKKVKYKNRKRGDLIFYSNAYGTVIHVAIYLGGGKVIESWPGKVQIASIKNSHRSRIKGVKRVFT